MCEIRTRINAYVVLAEILGSVLVTADERLGRALAGRVPVAGV